MQLSGVTKELYPHAYSLFKLLKACRELFGKLLNEDMPASLIISVSEQEAEPSVKSLSP